MHTLMRITRIERRKPRGNRSDIYVDGRFVLGVRDETLLKTGLRTGDEISADQLRRLKGLERLAGARASALALISYRARSVREMRDRLRKKGFGAKEIQTVVLDLTKAGMLDDGQLARMFIRDQLATHPAGRKYLKHKLRLHGISSDLADEAIGEITALVPETESARAAARKYLRTRGGRTRDSAQLRNRLAGYLSRRGFSWDTIRGTVNELLSESSSREEQ